MGNEKLTTLARRLRPFLTSIIANLISGGAVSEGPDIDMVATSGGVQVGRGGDTILIFDDGGSPVAEYAFTETGLDAAIAAVASGQTIQLPLGTLTITTAKTIPSGVTLRGMGRDRSVITGTGSIVSILSITGGTGSIADEAHLEDLTFTYAYTGTAAGVVVTFNYAAAKNVTINITSSTNTSTSELIAVMFTASKWETHPITDVTINATGLSTTVGIYIYYPSSSSPTATYSRLIVNAATTSTAARRCYGIWTTSLSSYTGRAHFIGCIATATTASVCVTEFCGARGLYHNPYGNSTYSDCIFIARSTAAGLSYVIGVENDGVADYIGCYGTGVVVSGVTSGKVAGIKSNSAGRIISGKYDTSIANVALSTVISIGCWLDGASTVCIGARFDGTDGGFYAGSTYDVYADTSALQPAFYACQYATYYSSDPTDTDPVYLQGDRGAYSVEDYHASDIETGVLTRHAPLASASSDGFMISDGTTWAAASPVVYEGEVIANDGDIVWLI